MSDEIEIPSTPIEPNENVTADRKIELLIEWKAKVEQEIAYHASKRDVVFADYRKQKERYDKTLGIKSAKIKKFDSIINGRKKVLTTIEKEIEIARNDKYRTIEGSGSLGQTQT